MRANSRLRRVSLPLLVLGVVLPLVACQSTTQTPPPQGGEVSAQEAVLPTGQEDPDKDEDKAQDKAAKIAEKKHELEMARMQLLIDEFENEDAVRAATLAVARAERELEEARQELAVFMEVQLPVQLERTKVRLDSARGRAADAEAELSELEAMYAEEEFAESTKELVITRSRRNLDQSKRNLALQETEAELEQSYELPKRQRDLELAVEKAEEELRSAQRALELKGLRHGLKKAGSDWKLEELQRKLVELTSDAS